MQIKPAPPRIPRNADIDLGLPPIEMVEENLDILIPLMATDTRHRQTTEKIALILQD